MFDMKHEVETESYFVNKETNMHHFYKTQKIVLQFHYLNEKHNRKQIFRDNCQTSLAN